MAVFSVNISDEDVGRVISAVCGNYGYQAQVENPDFDPSTALDAQTNPETILNPESESQTSYSEHSEGCASSRSQTSPAPPQIYHPCFQSRCAHAMGAAQHQLCQGSDALPAGAQSLLGMCCTRSSTSNATR